MKFTIGPLQIPYDIRFMYDKMPDGTVKTTCKISAIDTSIERGPEKYNEVARGFAQQSVHDTFDKDTGRKIALTRAVQTFPKINRKAAWEAYLNRKK